MRSASFSDFGMCALVSLFVLGSFSHAHSDDESGLTISLQTNSDSLIPLKSVMMDQRVIAALRETKSLMDEGVLTFQEFQQQKQIILSAGQPPTRGESSQDRDGDPQCVASSHHSRRLINSVLGEPGNAFLRTLNELADKRPLLKADVQKLEAQIASFASRALHLAAESEPHLDAAVMIKRAQEWLARPSAPNIVIKDAHYGSANETHRADIKWILEKLVINSVLRIPKGFDAASLFGTMPKGEFSEGVDYVLDVVADTVDGEVSRSVRAIEGILQSDLLVSNAQPSHGPDIANDEISAAVALATTGKSGFEIGGPSAAFQHMEVYQKAQTVDLINFSEDTLWSKYRDKERFSYAGGGSGTVHITDGATLAGIPDSSYDFALGSHYLEHVVNPVKALLSLRHVLKDGGVAVLVVPRKEHCFDHLRGTSSIEEILFRFVHDASEHDTYHANVLGWVLGSDTSRDPPAGRLDQLLARSLRFPRNRAIHVMVYDVQLLAHVGHLLSLDVVAQGVYDTANWVLLRKPHRG